MCTCKYLKLMSIHILKHSVYIVTDMYTGTPWYYTLNARDPNYLLIHIDNQI